MFETDAVVIIAIVFFSFLAWYLLANVKPDWVRLVAGVASAILAVVLLVNLTT